MGDRRSKKSITVRYIYRERERESERERERKKESQKQRQREERKKERQRLGEERKRVWNFAGEEDYGSVLDRILDLVGKHQFDYIGHR